MTREAEQARDTAKYYIEYTEANAEELIRMNLSPIDVWMRIRNIDTAAMAEKLNLLTYCIDHASDGIRGLTRKEGVEDGPHTAEVFGMFSRAMDPISLMRSYRNGIVAMPPEKIYAFCKIIGISPEQLVDSERKEPVDYPYLVACKYAADVAMREGRAAPGLAKFFQHEENLAELIGETEMEIDGRDNVAFRDIIKNVINEYFVWYHDDETTPEHRRELEGFEDLFSEGQGEQIKISNFVAFQLANLTADANKFSEDLKRAGRLHAEYTACMGSLGGVGKESAFKQAWVNYVEMYGYEATVDALLKDPRIIYPASEYRSYSSVTVTPGGYRLEGEQILHAFLTAIEDNYDPADIPVTESMLDEIQLAKTELSAWKSDPRVRVYLKALGNRLYLANNHINACLGLLEEGLTWGNPPEFRR